jgi:thiol-disulfide isomerase/thioredoxin
MKKAILLLTVVALASCNRERIKISGRIDHAAKQVLYLDEVNVYDTRKADSIVLGTDGKFSFTLDAKEPGFFQLRLAKDKNIVLFPEPGEHIRVRADADRLLPSLEIEGSAGTEQITKLIRMLDNTRGKLDSLRAAYQKATTDTVRNTLNREYQAALDAHRKNSIAYILTHSNSLSSLYALYQQYYEGEYVFYRATDLQFFRIVSDSLTKYHPDSKHVAALKAYTDNLINKYKAAVIMNTVPAESSLPVLALPDAKGDTINLKWFRGKYVFLTFWASYCSECVQQNLELKKLYDRYRNKGFEIVQVSFDNTPNTWKDQVRFDELPWVNLIDTRYPNSPVAGNFNITGIPSNYLIGKDMASILGKNLSATDLKNKLEDLIK